MKNENTDRQKNAFAPHINGGAAAKTLCAAFAILLSAVSMDAASPAMPMPLMAVPKLDKAPVIDGVMSDGEWDRAAACTGFVPAYGELLAHVQTVVWFGYDDKYLYVCFKNYRTEKNVLLSRRARVYICRQLQER